MSALAPRFARNGAAAVNRIVRPPTARHFRACAGPVLNAANPAISSPAEPNQYDPNRVTPEQRTEYFKRTWERRTDAKWEKAARERTETVPFPDASAMSNAEWTAFRGDKMLKRLARYCNVFADTFGGEFDPKVNLHVSYGPETTVHRGNLLSPEKMQNAPAVKFTAEKGQKYTMVLASPDDCIYDNNTETLHWMITNLEHDGTGGDTVCAYLPPTPPKGTGYHRYVFALYRQDAPLSVQQMKPYTMFSCAQFAQTHKLEPVGLAFMQCTWDSSVTGTFARQLGIADEPAWAAARA